MATQQGGRKMFFCYTTSKSHETKIIKENLHNIQSIIDEQRQLLHPSFRCIFIEIKDTIHVVIKVHFSVVLKHNMMWACQSMLNKLGIDGLPEIYTLNAVDIPNATIYGDEEENFIDHDLFVTKCTYDAAEIYEPNDDDLTDEYQSLLSQEINHIQQSFFNNAFKPWSGHKKHYIFTSSDLHAERACNILLREMYINHELLGNEVMNLCFKAHSNPPYGLQEALELWHGNSVKIMFFEDFNHNTEAKKTIILNMIKNLLKEYGKTISFSFFFHDNTKNIQNQLMNDVYPFEFIEFNNRNFNYEEACEYIKKEAYKYWVEEDQVLVGLKEDEQYSRSELKARMITLSTGDCA
jgi:hypothetical protein